ncbi:hypothetical protein PGTUg99_025708 [Puccinia graminis f. sp. tritici]|uniref:Uncharacterized protein n=1 Tax=Puccinia graminis f. sp. tritici TaxID=56615 RepID=A0A5B0SC84_PUCGR|nr:hypothetical protein PGTUg99_025708 [Puccinia graminis f. sp. tritici]
MRARFFGCSNFVWLDRVEQNPPTQSKEETKTNNQPHKNTPNPIPIHTENAGAFVTHNRPSYASPVSLFQDQLLVAAGEGFLPASFECCCLHHLSRSIPISLSQTPLIRYQCSLTPAPPVVSPRGSSEKLGAPIEEQNFPPKHRLTNKRALLVSIPRKPNNIRLFSFAPNHNFLLHLPTSAVPSILSACSQ